MSNPPPRPPSVVLPDGERVSALGLGTWRMGESRARREAELAALRHALERGAGLIDTAEMYGEGGAEEIVGEALAGRRDEVFLVSKVYPHNAGRRSAIAACERSLKRLRTDRIDLYLLHWPGAIPLHETVDAFERLHDQGKIRHWGVSNFDVGDMNDLLEVEDGERCAANQVYYSASRRGIEHDLVPWMHEHAVPLMAYCPLDAGTLTDDATLAAIGRRHGASAAQVAIAWLLSRPQVIAIPKAARPEHVDANLEAAGLSLTAQDLAEIDDAFPPPAGKEPLTIV
ncbi:MAG: aldo/keto reductase [Burkholderiaceae bacterium]